MDFLFDFIASVLAFFYDLTSSYGWSIVLLTLAVMVVVTPLTLKSTRSMIAMQRLQPELRKLQAKHKDDRQKLNEEMMAFYKENNINPMGGCLPLLVQMPVFIVLYRVLSGMVKQPGWGFEMGGSAGLALRNPAESGFNSAFGTFDPGYLDHDSALYQSLNAAREMRSFGLDLASSFTARLSDGGVVEALPYFVLVILIGVTAWYQQRQIMARNANSQSQINPQQQALMKIMPFFLPIISLTLPAGLSIYFLVSNLYRIGQQAFITRTMYSGDNAPAPADKVSRKDTVPSDRRGLLGGLVQLPTKTDTDDAPKANGAGKAITPPKGAPTPKRSEAGKAGGTRKGKTATATRPGGGKAKSPSRSAPSAPSASNRSKKKKPRK